MYVCMENITPKYLNMIYFEYVCYKLNILSGFFMDYLDKIYFHLV